MQIYEIFLVSQNLALALPDFDKLQKRYIFAKKI